MYQYVARETEYVHYTTIQQQGV